MKKLPKYIEKMFDKEFPSKLNREEVKEFIATVLEHQFQKMMSVIMLNDTGLDFLLKKEDKNTFSQLLKTKKEDK